MTVTLHFILAPLLLDRPPTALGAVRTAILLFLLPRMRGRQWPTSRLVGPTMGVAVLVFAPVSSAIFLTTHGSPF